MIPKLCRAKDEIKTITSSRDQFKQELTTLQSQLDSDSRITSLKEELRQSRELAAKRAVQLKSLDEESEIYKVRCKQLEEAASNQASIAAGVENREKKKLEDKIEGLEEEITELEFVKTDLTNQLKATKKRVVRREKLFRAISRISPHSLTARFFRSDATGDSRETRRFTRERQRSSYGRKGGTIFEGTDDLDYFRFRSRFTFRRKVISTHERKR